MKHILLTLLLLSPLAFADSSDDELINKFLEAEVQIDNCIKAKSCKELMSSGGPVLSILYDTNFTDALNRCTVMPKITKCGQVLGRINMKTFTAIEFMTEEIQETVNEINFELFVYKVGTYAQKEATALIQKYGDNGFPAFAKPNKNSDELVDLLIGPFVSEEDITVNIETLNQISGVAAGKITEWNP